jgi:hypothetical protein
MSRHLIINHEVVVAGLQTRAFDFAAFDFALLLNFTPLLTSPVYSLCR